MEQSKEQSKVQLISCLNMMRRLPPTKIPQNVNALIHLFPNLEDELLQRVDQPLEVETDPKVGKDFIKSEFNRDGDSYRSPWTNSYYPPENDGVLPSPKLRELEQKANILFEEYRKLYYEGGTASLYMWDKEEGDFACAYLVKKDVDNKRGVEKGTWDSINVIDVKVDKSKGKVTYKITTSIILDIKLKNNDCGDVAIAGTLTKQKEETRTLDQKFVDEFHLSNIGSMVEDMETWMRQELDTIYLGRAKEICQTTRIIEGKELELKKEQLRKEIFSTIDKKDKQ